MFVRTFWAWSSAKAWHVCIRWSAIFADIFAFFFTNIWNMMAWWAILTWSCSKWWNCCRCCSTITANILFLFRTFIFGVFMVWTPWAASCVQSRFRSVERTTVHAIKSSHLINEMTQKYSFISNLAVFVNYFN